MKNSTILIPFIIYLFTACNCPAQTQFQLAIGGTGEDRAISIIKTTDGGYAAAGWTTSFGTGNTHMYIIKLNNSGTLQWSKIIGGTGSDFAHSIVQTSDGGYAIAGWTNSFGAVNADFYIVKLNSAGTIQWSRTIGGAGVDLAYSLIQTSDGGYAAAGVSESFGNTDFYIVKLDSSGTLQWSRTIGGEFEEYAYSIVQSTDGGYAVTGFSNSFSMGYSSIYIVKLDAGGSLQWSKSVEIRNEETTISIIKTSDGGFALAGYSNSLSSGNDICIVKLNSSGGLQWCKTIGGMGDDHANSIIQTTDGGYAAAGSTTSFGAGLSDVCIVKLDNSGTLQWCKTIGGINEDFAGSIIQTTDGGYTVGGGTVSFGAGYRDMYIVKLDSSGGNTCGYSTSPTCIVTTPTTFESTPTSTDLISTPTVTSPISIVSSGATVTNICVTAIQPISNEVPNSFYLYQNYPNPFNPATNIKFDVPPSAGDNGEFVSLIIYDVTGRKVETLVNNQLVAGSYEVQWNANNVSSGIYFYTLKAGSYVQTKRMVLVK